MTRLPSKLRKHRRGTITVLAALLCVVILGMMAFALDVGYLSLARTQLQAAADSAALAAAACQSAAKQHGGRCPIFRLPIPRREDTSN